MQITTFISEHYTGTKEYVIKEGVTYEINRIIRRVDNEVMVELEWKVDKKENECHTKNS